MSYRGHLAQLDAALRDTQWLWQPQPYKEWSPPWLARSPALAHFLSRLTGEQITHYHRDPIAALRALREFVPELAPLLALGALPAPRASPALAISSHLLRDIPGHKLRQIEAFCAAVTPSSAPLLEWCGGKGHLGRVLSRLHSAPVLTLEHDPALCAHGRRLALRDKAQQMFQCVSVYDSAVDASLANRHAIALHACGELHRSLLRRAVAHGVPALDLVPCCYHLGCSGGYDSFSGDTRLLLAADDLRVAVTETVTAAPREERLRERERAWKLGFSALRRHVQCDESYQAIKSIEKRWLALPFAQFCGQLAAREMFTLPKDVDWGAWERRGWQLQATVTRLSLPRQSVRRALELWLVFDMATYLDDRGYAVNVAAFCDAKITPRNLLLSARQK